MMKKLLIVGVTLLTLTEQYKVNPTRYYDYQQEKDPSEQIRSDRQEEPPVTEEPEKIWKFQFNVPEMLRALKTYTGVSVRTETERPQRYYDSGEERPVARDRIQNADPSSSDPLSKTYTVEVRPDLDKFVNYVKNLISFRKQMNLAGSYVEEAPGTIKSEPIAYPQGYYTGKIGVLMDLKKKRDAIISKPQPEEML